MKKLSLAVLTLALLSSAPSLSAALQQGLYAAPGNNWGYNDRRRCCQENEFSEVYGIPRSSPNDYYYNQSYERGDWRRGQGQNFEGWNCQR